MAPSATAVRPRLRTNVFFAPSSDGTGALCLHGERVIPFQGRSTYLWLVRLAPHLDGRRTLSELVADMPTERRQMVQRLVAALAEAGVIRDAAVDEPHALDERELETYAPEIAFVEAFVDSPALRFQRYRECRVVVIGSGTVLVAMVSGLLRSGVRHVVAALTGPTDLDTLHNQRAQAADRDPGQRIDWHADRSMASLQPMIADAGLVLHACDVATVARATAVDRACRAGGVALVQLFVAGDEAWVGPVCRPDGPRWEDFWLRLRAAGGGADATSSDLFTGPARGIAANHAVFAGFEHVTGVAAADAPAQVVRVDLETLQTEVHRVVAYRPTAGEDPAALVQRLAAAPDLDAASWAERVDSLCDHRIGVLTPVEGTVDDQFPLHLAETTVFVSGDRIRVVAAALDAGEARTHAGLRALAVYASRTAARPADGVSLVGGAVRAIPPDAWQDADAGIAAALSWPAAVESGLLDQCLRLAVRRAFDPGRSGAAVDLDSLPPDEVSEHYRSLLDLAGQKVVVSDVTALPAIPTFAFRLDGDLVAYRAGLTATEAIRDGLRATLQAYQSRSSGQPDHAPAAIAVDPHLSQRPSGDRRETLVRALLDAGRVPVVVPLGDDPAVREALPHVLRVVLVDD